MSSDNAKDLMLAVSPSAFIGASFIVKKMGLRRAADSGVRADKPPTTRSRSNKPQGNTSSAAATSVKERGSCKEKETSREPATRERLRPRGKEKEMGGEGKEKQPAKENQKKPQGKEKEKEAVEVSDGEQDDGNVVRPQFFKVFFPEQSGERLKIPPMFHQYLKNQPTGPVSLKGPSGKKWQATLASESEVLCFEKGWEDFVKDHSLKKGYFLVFTYDGPSQFSVAVFSTFGIIDLAALQAKPMNEVAVKIEEEDEGVQGHMDAGGGAFEVSLLPNAVTGRRTRAMSGTSEIPPPPTKEDNEVIGKRKRTMNDLVADCNEAMRQHSAVTKKAYKRRHQAGTSKDGPTIVHSRKDKRTLFFL